VRQSSLLVRFGQLTPAFVLQAVAPLLLIFLGFGAIARERERGTLRLLMLQGASRGQIVAGKLGALGLVALLARLPAMLGFALIAGQPDALAAPMAVIALGYAAWLALWTVAIVLVSAWVRRSRDALLALLGTSRRTHPRPHAPHSDRRVAPLPRLHPQRLRAPVTPQYACFRRGGNWAACRHSALARRQQENGTSPDENRPI
jgi:hypothetical protein